MFNISWKKEFKFFKTALLFLCLGTFFLAFLGYFEIGTTVDTFLLGEVSGERRTLFGDNSNIIGIRMSISIIILISFFYHGYLKKLRFLFLVPIPLMIFTIAESGSRLAFISFFYQF